MIKRIVPAVLACAAVLFLSAAASAQQVEMSSSLNPVGSGARATGMGGAFIGVADDATAASWNPAGLAQLEKPEVSVVYANGRREQTNTSTSHGEINGSTEMSDNGINYLSAVVEPFELFGHKAVVSINYQRLYDMRKSAAFRYNFETASATDSLPLDISFEQKGYLYALSPAFALQVSPSFNVGLTVNFWKDLLGANGWTRYSRVYGSGTIAGGFPITEDITQRDTVSFDGVNANLGFLWNATSTVTVGGVLKTAFDAKLIKTTTIVDNTTFNGGAAGVSTDTIEQQTLKMPRSAGLGVQYRPSDKLTLALDMYHTDWAHFVLRDAAGNETNPVTGASLDSGRLRSTTQVRLGGEYLFILNERTIAARAGVFSDPEPAMGKVDKYKGFSLGAGYSTKSYALDAAYQYRKGTDVTSDIVGVTGSTRDVTQQTVMVSVIHYY